LWNQLSVLARQSWLVKQKFLEYITNSYFDKYTYNLMSHYA